jgi:imidazolonepropionase-like amidohydrolase
VSNAATVIRGRVVAGEGLTALADAVVVISNSKITAVGRAGEAPIPDDANTVAAPGTTLLPGFIDAHVHIGLRRPAEVVARGVTTVRDLGWPPAVIHRLAQRSRSADFDGPSIVAAGPMLTCPGGYPTKAAWAPSGTAREVRDRHHARDAVEQTAEEGAVVIKVALNAAAGPTLDFATLDAIVSAAHGRGLSVTGHVHGLHELSKALDAGMDELAHMLMSTETLPPPLISRMVSQGMTVVPTLSIRFGRDRRIAIDNLRRFVEAGGKVVYGTDLGNSGPQPGIDEREIKAMRSADLTMRDIIASATVDGARHLRLDCAGWIEPGKDADVIAVDGNALEDDNALNRVRLVFRKGKRVR